MKIDVIPFASAVEAKDVEGKTVVVIDVLRATSVMATAIKNGAKQIIPCISIEEAREKSAQFKKGTFLLCGERDAVKIEGFDLGNSPLEYTPEAVGGKTLLITTTNGTRALRACTGARSVFLGSFLNVQSTVEATKNLDELVLVCSGTAGKFSMDDGMCAAMIMHKLSTLNIVETDDLGKVLLSYFREEPLDIRTKLSDCFHLKYLIKMGYREDVDCCTHVDCLEVLPEFDGREVKVFR
jgi:2-phosphosulfolactate phosphatase